MLVWLVGALIGEWVYIWDVRHRQISPSSYLRVDVAKVEEGVRGERGPQGGQQDVGGQEAEVEEPAAVEEVERLRGGLGPETAVDEGEGAHDLFRLVVCGLDWIGSSRSECTPLLSSPCLSTSTNLYLEHAPDDGEGLAATHDVHDLCPGRGCPQ